QTQILSYYSTTAGKSLGRAKTGLPAPVDWALPWSLRHGPWRLGARSRPGTSSWPDRAGLHVENAGPFPQGRRQRLQVGRGDEGLHRVGDHLKKVRPPA